MAEAKVKIVKSDHEGKEEGIRVKCQKCGAEEVLSSLGGWFYIILEYTVCRVCGTKIKLEED